MRRVFLPAVLILLALFAVACNSGEGADAVQELELTASDIKFDKTQVEVVAGRPVRLTLHNEGALEHDFSIMHIRMSEEPVAADAASEDHMMEMEHMDEDPELHTAAMPGLDSLLEFTPAEAGEYEFFCAVPGHKEAGMKGTLIVRER